MDWTNFDTAVNESRTNLARISTYFETQESRLPLPLQPLQATEIDYLKNTIEAVVATAFEDFNVTVTGAKPSTAGYASVAMGAELHRNAPEGEPDANQVIPLFNDGFGMDGPAGNCGTLNLASTENVSCDVEASGRRTGGLVGRAAALDELGRRLAIVAVHELGHGFGLLHHDSMGDPLFTNTTSLPVANRHMMIDGYVGANSSDTGIDVQAVSFSALEFAKLRYSPQINAAPLGLLSPTKANDTISTATPLRLGEAVTFDRELGAYVAAFHDGQGKSYFSFSPATGDVATVQLRKTDGATYPSLTLMKSGSENATYLPSGVSWPVSDTMIKELNGPGNPATLLFNTSSGWPSTVANYIAPASPSTHYVLADFSGSYDLVATLHRFRMAVAMPGPGNTTDLVITGTTGADTIDIAPDAGNSIRVSFAPGTSDDIVVAPSPSGTFAKIYVYGYAGDDQIKVANDVSISAEVWGHEGNDTLIGGQAGDVLWGGAGDDVLKGESSMGVVGGADQLHGGLGNDTLEGARGNDLLEGGAGDDRYLFSNSSAPTTSLGQDTVSERDGGGADEFDFQLFSRRVQVDLNATNATMTVDNVSEWYPSQTSLLQLVFPDGSAPDVIERVIGSNAAGGDRLYGNAKPNRLDGRAGDDLLVGRSGDDTYAFGYSAGSLDLGHDTAVDAIDEGNDTLDFSGFARRVFVDLNLAFNARPMDNTAAGWYAGDSYLNLTTKTSTSGSAAAGVVENVIGTNVTHNDVAGAISDVIYGDGRANRIWGRGGYDILLAYGGDDYVSGGEGNDLLSGGVNNDTYAFGAGTLGTDTLEEVGSAGDVDTLDFGMLDSGASVDLALGTLVVSPQLTIVRTNPTAAGNLLENVVGTRFDDTLLGDSQANRLWGLLGDDKLNGRDGDDVYSFAGYEFGFDKVEDDDTSGSSVDTDTLDFSLLYSYMMSIDLASPAVQPVQSYDNVLGYSFISTLTLVDSFSDPDAGPEIENVYGTMFTDRIYGDGRNNQIWGLGGADRIWGRGGDDTLSGGDGDDTYFYDSAAGDLGWDTLVEATGAGSDTIDLKNFSRRVLFNLASNGKQRLDSDDPLWYPGTVSLLEITLVNPNGFENCRAPSAVQGTYGSILYGNDQANGLEGSEGLDQLHGYAGNDALSGLGQNDLLFGGTGGDKLIGGLGADQLYEGTSTTVGDNAVDWIYAKLVGKDEADGRDLIWAEGEDEVVSFEGPPDNDVETVIP